jgi:glycosyltransferase involved in cell wall biosynthesis
MKATDNEVIYGNNKMRVIQIIPDLGVGGAERMVAQLSIELADQGAEVKVISLYNRRETMNEAMLDAQGVDVSYLSKKAGLDFTMFSKLRRELRKWQPDIIHTHRYVLRYLLPHLFMSGHRWIHTVHNVADREVGRTGRAIHRVAFAAGVIPVAISEEVARSTRTLYGLQHIPLIPNGIDLFPFVNPNGTRSSWRQKEGIPNDRILFIALGRLTPQKNHALLLESFSRLANLLPKADLLIAGEGELRFKLERIIDEKGLNGRVALLGVRNDVAEILLASDIFVMSSDWEGNPLSVMEALSAGLPAISTAVGGVPELIVSGKTGLLVPSGDPEALSDAMLMIGSNERLISEMGHAARLASSTFSVKKMAERYLNLYEKP